jgi:putative aldouronate transport system substrate-binding protein
MKKLLALLITLTLLVTLFAGCSSTKSEGEKEAVNTPSETKVDVEGNKEQKINEYGWKIPEKTIEIQYFKSASQNPDLFDKNAKLLHDYLLEKFNVKITAMMTESDPKERLNLMLASNDYPAVMTNVPPDVVATWKDQGKLLDLTALVDETAPNLKSEFGELYPRTLDSDGKLWSIPMYYGMGIEPGNAANIRWDWYNALGSPKLETTEDYYNIVKQMVADHPTNALGEKTYGISWSEYHTLESLGSFFGLKSGYKEDAAGNLTHWLNTTEGLEMVKYYNRFYREGLLDPDAFTNKYDDWKAKFSAERIAGHLGAIWMVKNAGHEVWVKSMPDWTDDKRFVQVSIKSPNAEKAYLNPGSALSGSSTVITDKAKNPKEIMEFLNFTLSPLGSRLMAWGVPNQPYSVWNLKDDGSWTFNQVIKDDFAAGKLNFEKLSEMGLSLYQFIIPNGYMKDDNASHIYVNSSKELLDLNPWDSMAFTNMADTIYDNSARAIVFTPENPLTIVNQRVTDSLMTGFAKAVMSKTEAESEANFNELRDNMNRAGLHDLEKFITDEYKKKSAK